MDYSRAPYLGAKQKTRGLWERDCKCICFRQPCSNFLGEHLKENMGKNWYYAKFTKKWKVHRNLQKEKTASEKKAWEFLDTKLVNLLVFCWFTFLFWALPKQFLKSCKTPVMLQVDRLNFRCFLESSLLSCAAAGNRAYDPIGYYVFLCFYQSYDAWCQKRQQTVSKRIETREEKDSQLQWLCFAQTSWKNFGEGWGDSIRILDLCKAQEQIEATNNVYLHRHGRIPENWPKYWSQTDCTRSLTRWEYIF